MLTWTTERKIKDLFTLENHGSNLTKDKKIGRMGVSAGGQNDTFQLSL